jgi:hypothetical protein
MKVEWRWTMGGKICCVKNVNLKLLSLALKVSQIQDKEISESSFMEA